MAWEIGPSGFVQLSFSNGWIEDGGSSVPVLSARATYLVRGATAIGVWIDDRPQRLTSEAVVTDSSVVTHWSAETEDGRTEYVVRFAYFSVGPGFRDERRGGAALRGGHV